MIGLGLSLAVIVIAVSSSVAQDSQDPRRRAFMPFVRDTTQCLTNGASQHLPSGWEPSRQQVQSALNTVLADRLCDRVIDQMVAAHDRLYGPGTGSAFLIGPYLSDAPRAVLSRLKASTALTVPSPPTASQPASSSPPRTAPSSIDQPASAHTVSPGIQGRITDKVDADTLRRNASLFLAIVGACTFVLFVLGCGNRVVVFASPSDLGMSATIVLAPIITVLAVVIAGLTIAQPPDRIYANAWENAKDNPLLAFFIIAGGLTWVWSVLGTIYSSIKHNGFILGPVIAVLKLGAMIALFVVWFVAWKNYEDSDRYTQTIAKLVTIGFLFWIGSRLINGQRVLERRGIVAEQRTLALA